MFKKLKNNFNTSSLAHPLKKAHRHIKLRWKEYVMYGVATAVVLFLVIGISQVKASACVAAATGNWNTPGTWDCGHVPTNVDLVTINSGATVTLDADTANAIQGITINGTLDTSGSNYAVNATSIAIGGTGTLIANGSMITLSGTSGTLFTNGGTFTRGTSTVKVSSSSGTPTLLSAATTFHGLTIDATATVINAGFLITIDDASGAKLYVKNGVLNDSGLGYATSASTTNTLQIDAGGILCLGGAATSTNATCDSSVVSTTARTMPTFHAYAFDPVSTVLYLSDADIDVSGTPVYGNLVLRPNLTASHAYTMQTTASTSALGWTGVASSSDGSKLAAIASGTNYVYTSSDSGLTWVQQTASGSRSWRALASSSDGTKLAAITATTAYTSSDSGVSWTAQTIASSPHSFISVAMSSDGTKVAVSDSSSAFKSVYTSSDSGVNWTQRSISAATVLGTVVSSSDGTKLAVADRSGYIYTSANSGVTWVQQTASGSRTWRGLASSSDGTKLAAGASGDYVYTSTDSGVTWTQQVNSISTTNRTGLASSSDGTKLAAVAFDNYVYTSSDSGVTWTQQTGSGSRGWNYIASSSDGTKLLAANSSDYVYMSADSGVSWVPGGALTVLGNFDSTPTSAGTANRILTLNLSSNGMKVAGSSTLEGRLTSSFVGTTALSTNTAFPFTTGSLSIAQTNGVSSVFTPGTAIVTFTNTSGTIITNTGTFTAPTGGTVAFSGNGSATVNSAAITFYNVIFTGTGTKTLGAAMTVNAAATTNIAAGTLDTSSGGNYGISTGKLIIGTGATFNANTSTVTLTATSGTLITKNGTFNQGSSNVIVSSSGSTPTLLSAATTFHILTISNTSFGIVNAGASVAIDSVAGNALTINGTFNDGGNQIVGSNGTFTIGSAGTFCLGGPPAGQQSGCNSAAGATTATTMPTFSTYSFNSNSTVIYAADAAQTISSAPTYGNLKLQPLLSAARTYTFSGGTTTIAGTAFTIQPVTGAFLLTVNMAGDINVPASGTTTITGTTATSSLVTRPASTDYNLSTGKISIGANGKLDCTNAASTIKLTATSGTLFTRAGTFTQGSSNVTVVSSSGTPTFLSAGTTFHILTINAAATIINAGFLITIDDTSGASLYVQRGVLTDAGLGYATTASTQNTLRIDSTGTLCIGGPAGIATNATCDSAATATTARTLPTFHTYTISTCVSSVCPTVRYVGNAGTSGSPLIISSAPTYGNLQLAPRQTAADFYTFDGPTTISGNFTIQPTVGTFLFTVRMAGDITVNSAMATTITRSASATATLITRPASTDYNLSTGSLTVASGGTLDCTGAASVITLSGTGGMPFVNSGTFNSGLGLVLYTGNNPSGSTTITVVTYHDLQMNNAAETYILGGTTIVNNALIVSAGTLDTDTTNNYAVSASDISIAPTATFLAHGSTITVGENWTNSGTFTPGTSEVVLNTAATAAITGATTFYNLTISPTTAKEVDFSTIGPDIISVTNFFTANGHAGALVKLYSTSSGTKWHFKPTGTTTVSHVDVKDGGCESGAVLIHPVASTNSGNNDSCWIFFSMPHYIYKATSANTVEIYNGSGVLQKTVQLAGDYATTQPTSLTIDSVFGKIYVGTTDPSAEVQVIDATDASVSNWAYSSSINLTGTVTVKDIFVDSEGTVIVLGAAGGSGGVYFVDTADHRDTETHAVSGVSDLAFSVYPYSGTYSAQATSGYVYAYNGNTGQLLVYPYFSDGTTLRVNEVADVLAGYTNPAGLAAELSVGGSLKLLFAAAPHTVYVFPVNASAPESVTLVPSANSGDIGVTLYDLVAAQVSGSDYAYLAGADGLYKIADFSSPTATKTDSVAGGLSSVTYDSNSGHVFGVSGANSTLYSFTP